MLRDTLLEIAAIGAICISLYLFSNEGPVSHLFGKGTNVLQTWLKFGAGSSLSFAVCLLVFGLTGGLLSKVLSSRTAVYLGEISYALYLVQSPVLETIKELPATAYSSPIVIFLAANAICFCLAIFLHHLVENPFRRLIISRSRTERWQITKGVARFSGLSSSNWKGVAAAIGLACAVVGLYTNHKIINPEKIESDEATQWIAEIGTNVTPPIEFKDEAKLKAFNVETSAKSIDITFAWEVLPTQQRFRVLHFVNENDRILGQNVGNWTEFSQRGIMLDRCTIRKTELPKRCRVGITFFGRGQGCVVVKRGVRSMNNCRLDFFDWDGKNVTIINHLQDE